MTIEIRKLPREDSSEAIIYNFISSEEHLLPDPFSTHVNIAEYAHKLKELGVSFVALLDNEVVGLISGYINDYRTKESYIQLLLVSRGAQRIGLGARLIRSFLMESRQEFGAGSTYLTVDRCNKNAYEIYRHLGFVESDRIHPNENKQIMVINY